MLMAIVCKKKKMNGTNSKTQGKSKISYMVYTELLSSRTKSRPNSGGYLILLISKHPMKCNSLEFQNSRLIVVFALLNTCLWSKACEADFEAMDDEMSIKQYPKISILFTHCSLYSKNHCKCRNKN